MYLNVVCAEQQVLLAVIIIALISFVSSLVIHVFNTVPGYLKLLIISVPQSLIVNISLFFLFCSIAFVLFCFFLDIDVEPY